MYICKFDIVVHMISAVLRFVNRYVNAKLRLHTFFVDFKVVFANSDLTVHKVFCECDNLTNLFCSLFSAPLLIAC